MKPDDIQCDYNGRYHHIQSGSLIVLEKIVVVLFSLLLNSYSYASELTSNTIYIGVEGGPSSHVSDIKLSDGKDDQDELVTAINELSEIGGGEIIILPGIYHWYTNKKKKVVINAGSIQISGSGQATKILLHEDVPAITILGSNFPIRNSIQDLQIAVVHPGYKSSVIVLKANKQNKFIRGTRLRDISIVNRNAYEPYQDDSCVKEIPRPYSAIKLVAGNRKKGSYILNNSITDIVIDGFKKGISLETRRSIFPWINGNIFESIFIENVIEGVSFHLPIAHKNKPKLYNHNTFTNIKIQTAKFTKYGFYNISGNGNVFFNNHVWDWQKRCAKNNTYKYKISDYGENTVLWAHKSTLGQLENLGLNTSLLP